METRIDIQEEPISDESLQSGMHFTKTCQVMIPEYASDNQMKVKEEPLSEMNLNAEMNSVGQCEFNTADVSEMVIKKEVKEEIKEEPETVELLSARLNSGNNFFPSELLEVVVNCGNDTDICRDNKLKVKKEIEPECWLEKNSAEITSELEGFPASVPSFQNINKEARKMIGGELPLSDLPSVGSSSTASPPPPEDLKKQNCIKIREDNTECENSDVCKSSCLVSSVSDQPVNCKESSSTYVSNLKKLLARKKLHKCEICEKTFTQLPHLKTHYFIHKGIKPHKCEICDKHFSLLSNLRKHKLIHEGNKPYSCRICKKRFSRMSNLKRHNLKVCKSNCSETCLVSDQPFNCKDESPHICEKSLAHASDLKRNNLIRGSKKLHKCEVCEKTFPQLSLLKIHCFIHEGIKPFKCEICDKNFSQLANLNNHKLIHEGSKPYSCGICERSFSRLSNLKRHNLIHEGIRPYNCEICDKNFFQKSHLKMHKLACEGQKPHSCEICEKRFSRISNLKLHYIMHTRKKNMQHT